MSTDKTRKGTYTPTRLLGIGAYILANLLLLPLYVHVLIGVWINMAPSNTYDPLDPCHGSMCDGPNYLAAAAFSMTMLLSFALTAYTGTKVGGFRDFWRVFAIFMILPLAVCVALVLVII